MGADSTQLSTRSSFFLMIRRPPRSTLFPYHDALPICDRDGEKRAVECDIGVLAQRLPHAVDLAVCCIALEQRRSEEHTSELQSRQYLVCRLLLEKKRRTTPSDIVFAAHSWEVGTSKLH